MKKLSGWGLRAFLTGSHAYGEPSKDSDVDLVIFISEDESYKLEKLADKLEDSNKRDENYGDRGGRSLRFGKLNLLCFDDKEQYEAWRKGTSLLKQKARKTHPIPRSWACRFLDDLFRKMLPKEKRPRTYVEKLENERELERFKERQEKKKVSKKINEDDDEDNFEF